MIIEIGKKDYNVKITNQVIWDIEEVFDKEISSVLKSISEMKTKDLGLLIYHSVKDEISFKVFAENIKLNEYIPAATVVLTCINKAFGIDEKKK